MKRRGVQARARRMQLGPRAHPATRCYCVACVICRKERLRCDCPEDQQRITTYVVCRKCVDAAKRTAAET